MLDFLDGKTNWYLICGIAGLAASVLVVLLLIRKRHVTKIQFLYLYILAALGLFIGGHLLFFLVGLPDFIRDEVPNIHSFSDFLTSFSYAASGMVFYGGLLFVLLFLYIYCKRVKLPVRRYMNIMVVTFPLFHFFGRIGCTLSGCCYGIEYHGHFALTYPAAIINEGVNDHLADFSRFPIQPMEALLELILFIVLLIIYVKKEDAVSITSIYLIFYSVIRFADEYLRGDVVRGIWGPFSTSQWISLAILIGTVIVLIVQKTRTPQQRLT